MVELTSLQAIILGTSTGATYLSLKLFLEYLLKKRNGPSLLQLIKEDTSKARKHAEDNAETMKAIRTGVASGAFGCVWKGRDEVRDHEQALKNNTTAQTTTAFAVDRLTDEVKGSRMDLKNGRSK